MALGVLGEIRPLPVR